MKLFRTQTLKMTEIMIHNFQGSITAKNPHIRTYRYGLSLIRALLAIHNLAK